MKLLRMGFIVLVLVGLLLVVSPSLSVFAQDATVEANPIALVTEEAAAPVIVCEDGATCNVNEGDGTPAPVDNSPLGLLLVVGGGFVSVVAAISLGLQALGNRAQTAANNPLEIAVIEKAYESISPAILTTIIEPLKAALERSDKALQSVLDLLNKAGDKVPEASKPTTPYPPATGTPLSTDYTLPKTDTLPNRPDGGASGAGAGFPPVR
jgi:hypothetical protein